MYWYSINRVIGMACDIACRSDLYSIVYDIRKDTHLYNILRWSFAEYRLRKDLPALLAGILKITSRESSKKRRIDNKRKLTKKARKKLGKKAVFIPVGLSISKKAWQKIETMDNDIYSYMVKAFNNDIENLKKWCARHNHSMMIFPKFVKYKRAIQTAGGSRVVYEPHIHGVMFADCMAVIDKLEALWCDGKNHKMGYKRNNKGAPFNFWAGDFLDYENPFYGFVGGDFDKERQEPNKGYLNTCHNIGRWLKGKAGGYGRSILKKKSMFDLWDIYRQGKNIFWTWASGLVAYP